MLMVTYCIMGPYDCLDRNHSLEYECHDACQVSAWTDLVTLETDTFELSIKYVWILIFNVKYSLQNSSKDT